MPIPKDGFPPGFVEWLEPLYEGRQRFVANFSADQRALCRAVVSSFVETGQGPSFQDLATRTGLALEACESLLRELDARDFLVREGDRVLAMYPFSDRPCAHKVEVGGKCLYAM